MSAFSLNEENEYLNAWYASGNYRVLRGLKEDNSCIVFFSGNGLYYPDDFETFRDVVMYRDRYEWARLASRMIPYVSRIILIRDVRKCWYAYGLNSAYDSVEKTLALVKELCGDKEAIYAGSSAGGYMAALAAVKLGGRAAFSWGGQCNIADYPASGRNRFFQKRIKEDARYREFSDLRNLKAEAECPLFYFYSAGNETDRLSAAHTATLSNACCIALDTDEHGKGFRMQSYVNLFRADRDELLRFFAHKGSGKLNIAALEEEIDGLFSEEERYVEAEKKDSLLKRVYKRITK